MVSSENPLSILRTRIRAKKKVEVIPSNAQPYVLYKGKEWARIDYAFVGQTIFLPLTLQGLPNGVSYKLVCLSTAPAIAKVSQVFSEEPRIQVNCFKSGKADIWVFVTNPLVSMIDGINDNKLIIRVEVTPNTTDRRLFY